jgi:hypothetical protein
MWLQLAALRIDAFDLGETDVGARQRVAHQVAICPDRLMDRADITASEKYDRLRHFTLHHPQPF